MPPDGAALMWAILIVAGEIGAGLVATSLELSAIWVVVSIVLGGAAIYALSVWTSSGSANGRTHPRSPSKVPK